MKKLISLGACLMLAASVFATGNEGVNPPQSGVVTFTATNSVVTAFPFPYVTPPVMQLFGSVTNLLPITNSITTTNFTLTIAATNAPGVGWGNVAWQAYVGGTRMESGITTNAAALPSVSVVFPNPYAIAPVVVMTPFLASTNIINYPTILSVSLTNFTYAVNGGSTNFWISIGTVFNPPSENVGPNPPFNKVLY